ncbi:hypothetical protein SAMN05443999_10384 [Roseovarius azorensis]|uniref:Uncharacterized protein n=1 Tax=Roseovarius azorensis TaxID=1287727 RepID=A0A1H7LLD8_9RHOB|nr:hypothetical protein [Roseovarius azorensis]SEK99774.1 hypothetical protein SAMN05443999_10384 [Roseovarius azorensis]
MHRQRRVTPSDPFTLLRTPLGKAGSGRVRYGAAMALWRDGHMNEAQLEVYREASAHDDRNPLVMLHDRGLPAVST